MESVGVEGWRDRELAYAALVPVADVLLSRVADERATSRMERDSGSRARVARRDRSGPCLAGRRVMAGQPAMADTAAGRGTRMVVVTGDSGAWRPADAAPQARHTVMRRKCAVCALNVALQPRRTVCPGAGP